MKLTMNWGERKSYLILVGISLFMSLCVLVLARANEANNEHKFCQLITASLAGPAPKPANPKTDPSRARLYDNYLIVRNLGRSLGCL